MGTNTLETSYSNGDIIDASHINEVTQAIVGAFIGRNTSGVPATGQSLGSASIPWGPLFCDSATIDGTVIDPTAIATIANRLVSGASRGSSEQPDFLRPDGSNPYLDILGATTNLIYAVNGSSVTLSADLQKTGLTPAPGSNNTCAVNDTSMSNDKYAGEDGSVITIDTVGSEVSARVGEIVAFKNGTEIMIGYLRSATEFVNVYRGYFFNSAGTPLDRANLSNNDTLTLMNLGWVFLEDNASTIDVTYTTPSVSYAAPSGPATGDYWLDLSNATWKRYSGTSWVIINRMLLGVVALDATNCIGARSFDFYRDFKETNTVVPRIKTTEIAENIENFCVVNVYGNNFIHEWGNLEWNITADLESGQSETSATWYYLYLDRYGQKTISETKPYNRRDLKGHYHPHHAWRCVGSVRNDGSSNLVNIKYGEFAPTEFDANVFRASITSGGTVSSHSPEGWITSVSKTVTGQYNLVYKTGLFFAAPRAVANKTGSASNSYGCTITNEAVTGCRVNVFSAAGQADGSFNAVIIRDGDDYRYNK